MKKLLSMLLAIAMVLGMIPVMASAAETAAAAPSIDKVSMTLNGILDVNFKVSANGADMSGYLVEVVIGDDDEGQSITSSVFDGTYYVYTAKLPAHRMPETLTVSLVSGDAAIETIEWTVASYLNALSANASASTELKALCEALGNYGTYAAAYAAGEVAGIAAVEAVVASDLDAYKHSVSVKNGTGLKPVTSLYLDDACDLRIKFNAEAFGESILYIDGTAVEMTVEDDLAVYAICELVPQDWGHLYDIKVVDGEEVTFQCSYSVLSYACINLAKDAELATGLNGLLKAMSLYAGAAIAYESAELPDSVISYDPVTETYTVKGIDDGAAAGFYSELISTEAALAFSIEAEVTVDQGGYTTGIGFVLEQDGNKMLFTYASPWDIGVIVENDGVLDLNNDESSYDDLTSVIHGGLYTEPNAFDTAGGTAKLKLVYDYANVYLMIWNGTDWVQLPKTAYPITNAGGDIDGADGIFNIQKGFNVGIGTIVGLSDHKSEKTGGGTVKNVVYTAGQAEIEYTNTLDQLPLRDTFILKDNGTYYLYATQYFPTLQCWSSTDKINWKTEGTCYFSAAGDAYFNVNTPEEPTTWAPEVYKIGDEYVMFATFTQNNNDCMQASAVLKASSPEGPYELWSDGPITPAGHSCLDATLYYDGSTPYMIYSHEGGCSCGDSGNGTLMYVKLTDDLKAMDGTPAKWFSCDEWTNLSFWESLWGGSDANVMDAPYVYTDANGQKWILWSTFLDGVYLQQATPFSYLGDTSSLEYNTITLLSDAGHGMIFDDGDQDILVLHAPNSSGSRATLLPVTLLSDGTLSVWDGFGADTAATRSNTYAESVTELSTVFVGDSFMDPSFWTSFASDLDGKDALCLGIGGSMAEDWINYFNLGNFQADTDPKNMVFNLGNNDIHAGVSVSAYMANMKQLITIVHEQMPGTSLYVFSIAHRTGASTNSTVDTANAELKAWCDSSDGLVTYVDVTAFDPAGSSATLNNDSIHPVASDYAEIFVPALENAGCIIEDMGAKTITSLSQITDMYGSYILGGDIAGNSTTLDTFYGTLDGAGYTISTVVPLFNAIDGTSSAVTNLNIVLTSSISGNGILAANNINWARIENVSISAANGAKLNATGVAGAFAATGGYSSFAGCSNSVEVVGVDITGGILGTIQGVTLEACSNSGTVTGTEAGGIVGRSTWETNTVSGCSNTGTVTVAESSTSDNPAAGGIVGRNAFGTLSITACSNEGTVTCEGHYAGGMVGFSANDASTTIELCNNYGDISAAQMAGGIAGWACYTNITISQCLNYGVITAAMSGPSNMEAGGIIARTQGNTATLEYCINYGRVIGWRSGGIGAYAHGATVNVTNCENYGESRGMNDNVWDAASAGIWGRTSDGSLTISNATNNGLVNGSMVGGIVGMSWASSTVLSGCTNNGSVVGWAQDAAGIMGRVQGGGTSSITDCTNNGVIVGKTNIAQLNTYTHSDSTLNWAGDNGQNGTTISRSTIVRVSQMSDISDSYDAWGAYVLVSDITWDSTKDFHGQLFGNGYTISTNVRMFNNTEDGNMYVEDVTVHMTESITSDGDGAIMFNAAFAGYAIKNVHFTAAEGATLTAGNNAGAVAAYGAGGIKVIGCVNEVDITASSYVGGIFGNSCNAGVALTGCVNYGDLSGCEAGGMIGRHYGYGDSTVTVTGCSNYGTLSGTTEGTGGIIGHLVNSTATFTDCHNYGDVTNSNTSYGAGGIIGTVNDYDAPNVTVKSCSNSGTITGGRVGGIIGYACNSGTTTVYGCTNTGSIVSTGGDRGVGGIMGYAAKGTTYITDCANYGTVNGSAVTDFQGGTGGILGTANDSWPTVTISGCLNNGTVIGGTMAGGIVGSCYYTHMTISDCTNTAAVSGEERVGGIIGSGQFGGSVTASNVSDTGSGLNLVGYIHVDVTVSGL